MTASPLSMVAIVDVRQTWPAVIHRLEQLASGEAWRAEDVYHQLLTANAFLWATPDIDGFVVLQVLVSPATKDLHIWIACNSSSGTVAEFMEQLREIARDHQCDRITFESGRRGWRRVLAGATIRQLYIIDV